MSDIFKLDIQSPTMWDKLSDNFFGTNKVETMNMLNNYELQKKVNMNKFQWNKEGMIQAGINPLANTQGLNNLWNSQSSSDYSGDLGQVMNGVISFGKDLLDHFNPVSQMKEMKKMFSFLSKF